jgi:Membrane dipeptidase (Peptidase family M19)
MGSSGGDIPRFADHIEHLINVAGPDLVGLGLDYAFPVDFVDLDKLITENSEYWPKADYPNVHVEFVSPARLSILPKRCSYGDTAISSCVACLAPTSCAWRRKSGAKLLAARPPVGRPIAVRRRAVVWQLAIARRSMANGVVFLLMTLCGNGLGPLAVGTLWMTYSHPLVPENDPPGPEGRGKGAGHHRPGGSDCPSLECAMKIKLPLW